MSFIMLWVLNFFKIFLFDIFKPFFLLQVVDMINKLSFLLNCVCFNTQSLVLEKVFHKATDVGESEHLRVFHYLHYQGTIESLYRGCVESNPRFTGPQHS